MLLILREEIVCTIILLFLMLYYLRNKVKDKERPFLKISFFALLHLIFDMATVFTVNHTAAVPDLVNRLLHVCFYLTGICFSMAFYNYVVNLTAMYKYTRVLNAAGYVPMVVFSVLLMSMPMEYVQGRGTWYSFGPLAYIGYALFMFYCTVSLILLIAARKRLETRTKFALIPIILVMYIMIIAQAIVPELLMTGADVTIICLSIFVALDNPDMDYKEQALWDFLTGLKNRNSYNKELIMYAHRAQESKGDHRMGIVVADMNNLKMINDTYGHVEGDRMIAAAADMLKKGLTSAEGIYRVGGDEFIAIYLAPKDKVVEREMETVRKLCGAAEGCVVPLQIAMGYASGKLENSAEALIHTADQEMYSNKAAMKQARGAQEAQSQ